MKIVYVVPLLAPYAITRFQELGKNEDVELHVIVEKDTFEERTGWKYQEIEGVHTYLLNGQVHSYSVEHKKSGYVIDNAHMYSKGLRRLVNNINPDICIVCNSTQLLSLLGPRKYKVGVVVEDTLRAEEGRKKLNRLVKRLLLKSADIYFPYSKDAMMFLKKNGIKQNCYPSSWSIGESFFEKKDRDINKLKEKFQLESSKKIYTIVSALIPRKGIKQFIDAWKDMPRSFLNNTELHIVGSGPLENELKNSVKEYGLEYSIVFRGNLPYADVADFLSCTDVFVLPTLEDLCSLAVFEAVASGLPVMTTIYNGARDLVNEGVNGYVFDPENRKSIIEALNKMDRADLHAMAAASKELSNKYTDKQVMYNFYLTLKGLI
ncbi:glycosyltransferase [Mediterraneibacter faecis]|uniref:glycosyltransferase n=1 Tax=Mediterraneibacter faecis TaxID=592978 RepID=UPI003F9AE9AA